jgi:SAM-dependent methyltransferase
MSDESYTGTDVLESLAGIENYNAYLASLVTGKLAPGLPLVDFGAGLGTFARRFREAGHEVLCIEPDEAMLAGLRRMGYRAESSLDLIPDGSLAAVYTFNVLEHIEDDVAAMRQIHRKLMSGGVFIVYVPALRLLWTSMDDKVKHFRRYTRGEMRRKLEGVGFAIETLHYADVLGIPASLAYKLVGPRDGRIDPAKARFYDRWLFPASRTLDKVFRGLGGKNVVAVATKR